MQSKVSSDWLPCYIKANWPVLEIFKMAAYFPDSPYFISGVEVFLKENCFLEGF